MSSNPPAQVELPDDGYLWLKYGEKQLHRTPIIRSYFKCSCYKDEGCKARKLVDFDKADPSGSAPEVKYQGTHNHDPLLPLENIDQGFMSQHLKLKLPRHASALGLSRQAARVPKRPRSEGDDLADRRVHGAETHEEEERSLVKTILSPGNKLAGGIRVELDRHNSAEGGTAGGGRVPVELKERNDGESENDDNNVVEFGETLVGRSPRRRPGFLGQRKSFEDLLSMGVPGVPLASAMQGTCVTENVQRGSSLSPKPEVFLRRSMLNRKPEPSVRLSGPDLRTGEQIQEQRSAVLETTNVTHRNDLSMGKDIANLRQSGVLDTSEQRRSEELWDLEEVVRGALSLTTSDLEPQLSGTIIARAGVLDSRHIVGAESRVGQAQKCASLTVPEHVNVAEEGASRNQTGGALLQDTSLLPVKLPRADRRSMEMPLDAKSDKDNYVAPMEDILLFNDSGSVIQQPERTSKYDELLEVVAPFIPPQIIRHDRTDSV